MSEPIGPATSIDTPAAFNRCFEENFESLYRFIARRVGTLMADDLAADTFATAYRRRATFDPRRGSLRSWLFGIANNLLRNHRRLEHHRLELDTRLRMEAAPYETPSHVDDTMSATSLAPRLAAALNRLNDDQREILLLHAWADLSHEEIANALDVAPGTVRSRLSRARAALNQALGSFDFDLWQFDDQPRHSSSEGNDHA